ncbi:tetratricopeptide repeat-containing sulfotransferase family protein [Sphingomonas astaxanthinifaciens]|uniref:Sulfotransferase n=1 Tax=Sphingomonas astaxanthinifaciens DSM 22298 TaxID=1123267 RepID=A0ABQ5Z0K7_9SPHN|nr:tetratricopeptide repeat-containing sulfotransferase family protein [Sphingomonas astaxanthinifaciens]GLR46298.1 hypothetical protein GCM10007925_00090 [Sphingomonas astaxanthinifaciens DSM 22298]
MNDPSDDIVFAGEADRAQVLAHGRRLLAQSPRLAAAQAREILRLSPHDGDALRLLAQALRRLGNDEEASEVELASVEAAGHSPTLVEAAIAIQSQKLHEAERLLRPWLGAHPDDAAALRMLAEIGALVGARKDAEQLLRKALEVVPRYRSARLRLVTLLIDQNRMHDAFTLLETMLAEEPDNAGILGTKADALGRMGDYRQAAALYTRLLERMPDHSGLWVNLGHVRNTLGDTEGSVEAYRRSAALKPEAGVVWWSLANLKTFRFAPEDVAVMRRELARDDLGEDQRLHLHFALGKAFEDAGQVEESFAHYAAGNAIRKAQSGYHADVITGLVDQSLSLLKDGATGPAQHASEAVTPIFIVGLPRAGSTLIEQILASHSAIEGTAELPVLPLLTRELEQEEGGRYPENIRALSPERAREIGERYLEGAAVYRKTDRPFFIDKLPNNWLHVALIARILPNARIIDARRHPLDCGWSLFKQNFARGQGFSYDLDDIGHYYRDYVRLMAAVDAAMPGRVHRVIHERLVEDSETEIRAMLDYVGVPFEEGVLRHHENDRAVRTPSAAQVRKPINREGMERWRPFEPWLGPLKEALGDVLDTYPEAPASI